MYNMTIGLYLDRKIVQWCTKVKYLGQLVCLEFDHFEMQLNYITQLKLSRMPCGLVL